MGLSAEGALVRLQGLPFGQDQGQRGEKQENRERQGIDQKWLGPRDRDQKPREGWTEDRDKKGRIWGQDDGQAGKEREEGANPQAPGGLSASSPCLAPSSIPKPCGPKASSSWGSAAEAGPRARQVPFRLLPAQL